MSFRVRVGKALALRVRTVCALMCLFMLVGCGGGGGSAPATPDTPATRDASKVLILYDAPGNQTVSKLGLSYAIMLRNLIGHFDKGVDLLPVEQYVQGDVENYHATFYLGSYSDNPVPKPFLADVIKTKNTVVWFKYNIWQMAWDPTYSFNQNYGFSFSQIRGLNSPASINNPTPGFFNTVQYKNKAMTKYYAFNASTGVIADPDIGATQIVDSAKAQALVSITNSQTQEQLPYIVKSGNFWYFADIPLSFIGPRDRYLVLCDILHDILGVNHATDHKALVRFEDVSYLSSSTALQTLTDYLYSKNIPFSLAVIPFFRDPLGRYSNGVAKEVHLADAGDLKNQLNYALTRGGKIVMHGYTHQYNSMLNPHTGASGDDFEFWNVVTNAPVAEDSVAWAGARVEAASAEFTANGFTPFAWETPHYQASPATFRAVAQRLPKVYQRMVYYTSETPNVNTEQVNKDFAVGQFFPYVIKSDYYGLTVLPENLGNIEYGVTTWQDLYQNAEYAKVVRDGVASFFFHPALLEPQRNVPGFADFQQLVDGISNLGYQWVGAESLQ